MTEQIVPVQFGGEGWQTTPAPHALFVVRPVDHKPNIKQLARIVYRAIRMGWSPDNSGVSWHLRHYLDTRDCLPADLLRDDFQFFHYGYLHVVERIDRLSGRLWPISWRRIYDCITIPKETPHEHV